MSDENYIHEETQLDWLYQGFDDLDRRDLYAALALRQHTFVVEQKLNYQDADWEDPYAMHLLGKADGELVVYARLFKPHAGEDFVRIGRIITAPAFRGEGFGEQLMHKLFELIEDEFGACRVVLSSQVTMQKFYEKYGFQPHGETYLEAGTPHVRMVRVLAKAA